MYKIILPFVVFVFLSIVAQAQPFDIGVDAMLQPNDGCKLSGAETVRIRIRNYADDVSVPFTVTYVLNGGMPVTETVTSPVLSGSTITYTFSQTADLSTSGLHNFELYTSFPTDVDNTNDTVYADVNSYALSDGGSISGASTVCETGNSGTLTLSGETGNVVNWQYSEDGGASWNSVANTTNTYNFSNLTTTTDFRVEVQNGLCSSVFSSVETVMVETVPAGGSISGSNTVCATSNGGTLTLSGHNGNVIRWEKSTDGGTSWVTLSNTSTTQNYSNLTETTMYQAVVAGTECAGTAVSSTATVTVNPTTDPGTLTGDATICAEGNSGTLTLTGAVGAVSFWESTTDGGSTWNTISNTQLTYNYANVVNSTEYRVVVKSGVCAQDTSNQVQLTVNDTTFAGMVNSSDTVCASGNSGVLNLVDYAGDIVRWEISTDTGGTWVNVSNTTVTQTYSNLTATTMYRGVVKNGVCPSKSSVAATISVDPITDGGTVDGDETVCSTTNNGLLNVVGYTGSILHWEYSEDNGAVWNTIANSTDTLSFNNISVTTWYRAEVQSGVCASDYAEKAIISLTGGSPTVGGVVLDDRTECSGNNYDTLFLDSYFGTVLNWEKSTDGGVSWTTISNTNDFQIYSNLTETTSYRAVVQSGSCQVEISNQATVTIDSPSVGGTVNTSKIVCEGANNEVLDLVGYSGAILYWEYSDDNSSWTTVANTTDTISFTNLTQTRWYRAVVQNGVCDQDTSLAAEITVVTGSATVGGTLLGSDTVCANSNGDTLFLQGSVGEVLQWEMSQNTGLTWTVISSSLKFLKYANLEKTTMFRALVKSGSCSEEYSSVATVFVDALPDAGAISSSTSVCSSGNSGQVTIAETIGDSVVWYSSTDNGVTWNVEDYNVSSVNYADLTSDVLYQVVAYSGVCAPDSSSISGVMVDSAPIAGSITGQDTVCKSINSGTLTLIGFNGTIENWEQSTDNGNTWTVINNNSTTQNFSNLQNTTYYRVGVDNGTCDKVYTDSIVVVVDEPPIAGDIIGGTTVCSSGNSGLLEADNLIAGEWLWQKSNDAGSSWITDLSDSLFIGYTNLVADQWYRIIAKNGECENDTSEIAVVWVDQQPDAGLLTGRDTVCKEVNLGFLTLTGYFGSIIQWEQSTDNQNTWTSINDTNEVKTYSGLQRSTAYRVKVGNGVCNDAISNSVSIEVDEPSNAGSIFGATTVCESANGGALALNGYTGDTILWQTSIDQSTWSNSVNNSSIWSYNNLTETTYFRAIVGNGVCSADTTSIVNLIVDNASVGGVVGPDTIVCNIDNSGLLQLTGQNGSVSKWQFSQNGGSSWVDVANGSTSLYFNDIKKTTQYRAVVKNGVCSSANSASALVTVQPEVEIASVSEDQVICSAQEVTLDVDDNGTGTTYLWQNKSFDGTQWNDYQITSTAELSFSANESAYFRVIVDNTGCDSLISEEITIIIDSVQANAGQDTTISLGESIRLNAVGGIDYEWDNELLLSDPYSHNPIATPLENTSFTVTVTSAAGCKGTDGVVVNVIMNYDFYIPNVITPNGDLKNDLWIIERIEQYQCGVQIFNEFGALVFEADQYLNEWDGTNNGIILPNGTYFYQLKCEGAESILQGSINLFRGE